MQEHTTEQSSLESFFSEDPLAEVIRPRVRKAILEAIHEELEATLGAGRYERGEGRRGYRHGYEHRRLGTSVGMLSLPMPRARLLGAQGQSQEWRSRVVERYRRRSRQVDQAILSVYLSGGNTRRVKAALRPLLRGVPLSKSAVSRVVARLKEHFEAWSRCELGAEPVVYQYLDGIAVKVRRAGRVVSSPVLVIIGVRQTGEKILLGLKMAGSESTEAWRAVLEDLVRRGLRRPELCIIDGGAGLRAAVEAVWPGVRVQRCTVHKLRNLLAHAPRHAHELVREDYHRIVYAASAAEAVAAYERFVERWSKRAKAVAESLREAGRELLTFYGFPRTQWKSLRTTNLIERVQEEFRRRVKTQGSHPAEEAVLSLMFALFASGQIHLRRLDGWRTLPQVEFAGAAA